MKRLLLTTMLAHSVNLHLTILLRSFFDPSAVTAQNNEKYKIETYRPTKPSNNEKSIILGCLNFQLLILTASAIPSLEGYRKAGGYVYLKRNAIF